MKTFISFGIPCFILNATWFGACNQDEGLPDYPKHFREWNHINSMILEEEHPLYDISGGLHHIYANSKAFEALKNGGPYPDGSIFVFDLIDILKKDNAILQNGRKRVDVMQKNASKFVDTGGWEYKSFEGDTQTRVTQDVKTACYSCHLPQKDKDFVFSNYQK